MATASLSAVGVTRGGCRCAYVWAVNDGTCADGESNYHFCGMNPACDGDNLGESSVWSWCFLDDASKADPSCASPGANWDYCELGLGFCTENQYASGGSCHDCTPGTTRPAGDNPQLKYQFNDQYVATTCTVTTCQTNHHVEDHACVQCPVGATNQPGNFANGDDTACVSEVCGENQYVYNHACVDCPPGTASSGGDRATGVATQCTPIMCEIDQHVENSVCVDCPAGFNNPVRHSAVSVSTDCYANATPNPTPSPSAGQSGVFEDDGCSVPADPLAYFNFLGNARLRGSKGYWLQNYQLRDGVWTDWTSPSDEITNVTQCAQRCIEAGNVCLAFEMNTRSTALQCSLLRTGSTRVGGTGAPKDTWYAYDKSTFCGDFTQTTEEPEVLPPCPTSGVEYFSRGYAKRLKKTWLYTIGATGTRAGGRLSLNIEGCARACVDHGPECRSFEWKDQPKCDAETDLACGKCELKIYNKEDTAIKDNTGGWLIRNKDIFECQGEMGEWG